MHPELLSLSLFMLVTSCSPGPNNIVASYSGFNFGLVKTIPHMFGVIFGFTTLVIVMNFGLINIFKKLPILQETLKYTGSVFLIYLAFIGVQVLCLAVIKLCCCVTTVKYNGLEARPQTGIMNCRPSLGAGIL